MNAIALELPDDITDWPPWLERQLVGLHLRELVQQLEVIAGVAAGPISLDAVLAEKHDQVLQQGLGALDQHQLLSLVANPRLLLTLQEKVLESGGAYWDAVPRTQAHSELVASQWQRLQTAITDPPCASASDDSSEAAVAAVAIHPVELRPALPTPTRRWLFTVMAIAAVILLAALPWWSAFPEGRFFTAREVRESTAVDGAYLQLLAAQVRKDWQPNVANKPALRKQLTELRDSCDSLLAAELPQLRPAVSTEFKERCKKWRDKFTQCIAELDRGEKTLAEVRSDANATVERLTGLLIELAASA